MRVARVAAQAKINVYLRVYERDASGYHQVSTLFQRIDLADDVVVRVGGKDRYLDCSGPRLPPDGLGPVEKNLAFRAAEAYAARVGRKAVSGFAIELTKNIPVGGGLGGGSADGGAVLRALQALSPTPLAFEDVQTIARSLGSDVPFLASDYLAAFGSGRGEVNPSQGVFNLPATDILLVVPPFGIATGDAYRWLDEEREHYRRPETRPGGEAELAPVDSEWEAFADDGPGPHGNDFESVVEKRYPELRRTRERLTAHGARIARLAGSGSSVFGVFEESAPRSEDLDLQALVIRTRSSSRVVQVEVLE